MTITLWQYDYLVIAGRLFKVNGSLTINECITCQAAKWRIFHLSFLQTTEINVCVKRHTWLLSTECLILLTLDSGKKRGYRGTCKVHFYRTSGVDPYSLVGFKNRTKIRVDSTGGFLPHASYWYMNIMFENRQKYFFFRKKGL